MNWYVIIPMIISFIVVFLIGVYASRRVQATANNKFLQEYFLGGRELGGLLLAMTMIATYGSASSFIGGPGIAYNMGLGWVLLSAIQVVTGYIVLTVIGKKFAIIARKMEAITLIDYLKGRYNNKAVVILSALCIIIFLFSATVAQWVGGGRLIESLTGLSYTTALFLFTFSVLVYVLIGGFRAVALSDTLLGIIMLVGTTIILIATVIAGGGIEKIMQELIQINPNLITPFGADGSLTKSYVTSFWILIGIGVVGLPQISVRAMSYKNSKAMHQALIIGTVVVGTIMIGMHLTGVFARVVLPGITVPDKVMPLLAMEVLPPWLAGVFLAAPMAAIMSTVNSLLLLVSSSIIKDIYVNYINKDAADSTIRKGSLWITGIVGLLVYAAAIKPPDFLIWLNLFSFGGLEAAFIWPIVLGLYWSKGNATGALASILVGVGSYMCIHLFYPNPFGIHTVVFPICLAFIAYIIGSMSAVKKNSIG
ncbi:sodium/pantothenate symporter [Bacillus thuringiensis]|uniref:Sodium/pantothenate symporter n=1 Tax=Bacillus thuringiensis TaxID=1428 RepID=A0A4R4B6N6_BACTU|nr:sodium/pantothenate symporter [Bacillus thuringiensis]TCW49894.1 sodium/pantothenate symporter [Bacillus thuringiensis]TCW50047.1 sodium/pantothenate symporter [Bacillus thuringiensis]